MPTCPTPAPSWMLHLQGLLSQVGLPTPSSRINPSIPQGPAQIPPPPGSFPWIPWQATMPFFLSCSYFYCTQSILPHPAISSGPWSGRVSMSGFTVLPPWTALFRKKGHFLHHELPPQHGLTQARCSGLQRGICQSWGRLACEGVIQPVWPLPTSPSTRDSSCLPSPRPRHQDIKAPAERDHCTQLRGPPCLPRLP